MIAAIVLAGVNAPAQQADAKNKMGSHKFETLFVAKTDGGVGAYRSPNTVERDKVYEHEKAKTTIEWALGKARVTVLTEGRYVTATDPGITIDEDNVSLIVGPDATLTGAEDHPQLVVQVHMANHVNVFNLGVIDTGGEKGVAVRYEGWHGNKGDSGVKGGILFGSGRVKNVNAGYWAVDTEGMSMPLVWSDQHMNAPVAMEGVSDMDIGTIAQLALGEGAGEGEAIDMNMSCRRIDIDHVIGLAPTPGDEIVDINNGAYVTVDKITAFMGTQDKGALLVGYDRYGHSGMISKRPKVPRQKSHTIKRTARIRKDVKSFRRDVSYSGFPQSLPKLNVQARLTAQFGDGTTRELLNHRYKFDLTKPSSEYTVESTMQQSR